MNDSICNLCGTGAHRVVYDLETYRMLRCGDCGLVYRHPMPRDDELSAMYSGPPEVSQESLVAYYRDFRRRTFRRMFEELRRVHPLPAGARVLDVGAGNGWSYDVIREHGYTPLGIDLDFNNVLGAVEYGATVQAWSERLPIANGAVTAVLSTDLLEHVREPRKTLREIHRVLAPEGVYLLRVPDAYSVLIRAMDLSYALSMGRLRAAGRRLYRHHLYGFGVRTLRRYLHEAGFVLISYYRESSKNLAELDHKPWARNRVIRLGIAALTGLGEAVNRQDELIAIARKH
jgi:SAM-dependent methyltransferase